MSAPTDLPTRARAASALGVALLCAAFVYALDARHPDSGSDFTQLWYGARMLAAGRDPYALIGPGRAFDQPWPLYYPVPALVAVLPLAPLPLDVARAVFAAISGGVLAWSLTRRGWWPLAALASGPALVTIQFGQPVALIAAAATLPWLGVLAAGKPNGALVAMMGGERIRPVLLSAVVAGVFTLLTIACWPWWPRAWLQAIAHATHVQPYGLLPFGWLLLAAAIRWHDPAARVLTALAVVPTTPMVYDGLYLLAAPHPRRRLLVLSILSHIPVIAQRAISTRTHDFDVFSRATGRLMLLWVYLPALAWLLVAPLLRRRR